MAIPFWLWNETLSRHYLQCPMVGTGVVSFPVSLPEWNGLAFMVWLSGLDPNAPLCFCLFFYHVSLIGLYEMNSKLTIESSILSSTSSHHINSCFCSLMAYKLKY
eukprot:TRINITY_DN22488_c0_g2_i1.p1 TRINITY_DN22488_c0_g2~~TRINITY_DN22488_c0_g2_i1.p1  ORF type:complete len:105 (+),score=8.46 TRINITY_DN22488_c0_g2_i1:306-620(+)